MRLVRRPHEITRAKRPELCISYHLLTLRGTWQQGGVEGETWGSGTRCSLSLSPVPAIRGSQTTWSRHFSNICALSKSFPDSGSAFSSVPMALLSCLAAYI